MPAVRGEIKRGFGPFWRPNGWEAGDKFLLAPVPHSDLLVRKGDGG